ncbi:hypothetical protein BJY01DRAFT_219241 [Aspergillus pseudoustus]|uniref:Fungal-specific transcription factor domain-containing protein n=1 Tax=Aspergillus pseudoustus TaxID=1810923 RepID=A0ABR4JHH5_9EURO
MGDKAQTRQMQSASRPPRGELNFIITNPASKTDRADSIRKVRSHAGRRRWDQVRKAQGKEGGFDVSPSVGQEVGAARTTDGAQISVQDEGDSRAFLSLSETPTSTTIAPTTAGDTPLPYYYPLTVTDVEGCERSEGAMVATGPTSISLIPNQQIMSSQHFPGIGLGSPGTGILDPFQTYVQSPLSQDSVSTAYKYCLSVLWPQLMPGLPTSTQQAGVQTWYSLSMTDPALHSAMLYGAYAHQRAQSISKQPAHFSNSDASRQLVLAEVDAISKINSAIQDPSRATSDAIILSVLCLANNDRPTDQTPVAHSPFQPPLRSLQWLDVYGTSWPNPVHQAGLVRIIELCGGLDPIRLPGLAAVISFSDILAASRLLSRPRLPFVALGNDHPLSILQYTRDSASDASNEVDLDVPPSVIATPEMHEAFQAARAYMTLIERFLGGAYLGAQYTQALCDARNFVQWHIMSLLPATQVSSLTVQNTWISESCRLALVIFGIGVIFPLPPQSAPLLELVKLLQRHFPPRSANDDPTSAGGLSFSDNGLQKTLLWCLVMGGIAAFNTRERGWFVDELRFLSAENGLLTWREIRPLLKAVLWFDCACDRGGEKLWDEVRGSVRMII